MSLTGLKTTIKKKKFQETGSLVEGLRMSGSDEKCVDFVQIVEQDVDADTFSAW